MPSSKVGWDINGSVAALTLNRPETQNALTWAMYDAIVQICEQVEQNRDVRVLIIRGSGGAFSAGTDISQFRDFADGEAGVAYERRLDTVIDSIERMPVVTIAEVDGAAAGGGCAIAMACDLRICSERARFGVPISKTLGNCLSMGNTARMVDLLGLSMTRDLLLTGRMLDARAAQVAGLANMVVSSDELQHETFKIAMELSQRSPSTVRATKQMLRHLRDARRPPAGTVDDIIRECYGSKEFKEGVAAFLEGRRPNWE